MIGLSFRLPALAVLRRAASAPVPPPNRSLALESGDPLATETALTLTEEHA